MKRIRLTLRLGAALAALGEAGHDLAALAPNLQGWFRTWAAEGFFARVAFDEPA